MYRHAAQAYKRKLVKAEPEIKFQWIGAAIKMDAGNALSPHIGKERLA